MFPPDLSTGRNDRWTGLRASVKPVDASATRPVGGAVSPVATPSRSGRGPGPSDSRQRLSGPSSRPVTGSSASSRQPSRSTQSASGATTAEAAMPTEVSSMQPRNVRNPRARARSSIRRAGPIAAALGELDVDAGHDADQRRRGRRSSRRSRPRRAAAASAPGAPRRSSRRWAGNGCSMSSTPRRSSSGSRSPASSGDQPVLASTRIGPPNTERTARTVATSVGPPTLTLRAGKSAARRARSATTAGSSMPSVKSVGGISPSTPSSAATESPRRLPTRSWRAMSIAHLAAPLWPMAAAMRSAASSRAASAAGPIAAEAGRRRFDRLEQDGEDRMPPCPASRRRTRPGTPPRGRPARLRRPRRPAARRGPWSPSGRRRATPARSRTGRAAAGPAWWR